jgi:hypothetical protein
MMRHFGVQKELSHRRFVILFGARGRSFPERLCQKEAFFGSGCSRADMGGVRNLRGSGCGHRRAGFLGLAIWALVGGFSGGAGFYVRGLFSSIVNYPE